MAPRRAPPLRSRKTGGGCAAGGRPPRPRRAPHRGPLGRAAAACCERARRRRRARRPRRERHLSPRRRSGAPAPPSDVRRPRSGARAPHARCQPGVGRRPEAARIVPRLPRGDSGCGLRGRACGSAYAIQPMDAPGISVVVPTRGRAAYLEVTLDSLRGQRTDTPYELLVVDDGAGDAPTELADRFGARMIRPDDRRGVNPARNAGMRATGADLIAFVDDDVLVPPGWVDALV